MDILYIKDIKRCSIAKWKDLGLSKNGHRPFFISESDGFFEFGDKSFPIFFCSQSHVRMASHKMGRFIFWPNHYWCFKTFMFHHFSPFLTVQKKVKSLLVFQQKTMFQTWTCHLIYKPQNWAQIPWKVEKKGSIPALTWFKNPYLLKEPCHGLKKKLFCWFHGSPLSTTWDPSCRFHELHGCREHGRETGAPSCHWRCPAPEETGCISLCDRNMARSDLCKEKLKMTHVYISAMLYAEHIILVWM